MSLGRPGRCTSPAEIMTVRPPLSPDSMKSTVRWRGVKSPKTGWQCESMRPGMTVLPRASITVSASTSRPRPTAEIAPSATTTLSPFSNGRAMSPDTMAPMFLMTVFISNLGSFSFSPHPPLSPEGRAALLDREVGAAGGVVLEQAGHGPFPTNLALLDDVRAVGQPCCELEILLREQNGQALLLERGDLLAEGLHDHRRQPLGRLVEKENTRIAHERARHREHLLLAPGEAAPAPARQLTQLGKVLVDALDAPAARAFGTHEEIFRHREIAEDAPVFGHPAYAEPADLVWKEGLERPVIERDGAARHRDHAHDGLEGGGLARAVAPEQRDHLALARFQGDAVEHPRRTIGRLDSVKTQHDASPSFRLSQVHALHLRVTAHLVRSTLGDDASLVQYHDPIGDGEHHVHVVLGEEHGQLPLARDASGHLHELPALGGRHAGGGLVEEQHLGAVGEGHREL